MVPSSSVECLRISLRAAKLTTSKSSRQKPKGGVEGRGRGGPAAMEDWDGDGRVAQVGVLDC